MRVPASESLEAAALENCGQPAPSYKWENWGTSGTLALWGFAPATSAGTEASEGPGPVDSLGLAGGAFWVGLLALLSQHPQAPLLV